MSLPLVTSLPGLVDFVGLQHDLLHTLLSTPGLSQVNCIEERELFLQSEVEISAVWMTPRNGAQGAGIVVEMVKARVNEPNVSGPVFNLEIGCVAIEERNVNGTAGTGTLLTAEQIAQLVLDALHLYSIDGIGTLQAVGIEAAPDWIDPDSGIIAQRARLTVKNPRRQTARAGRVGVQLSNGLYSLVPPAGAAEVYFTLATANDAGQWLEPGAPTSSNTNAGAMLYAGESFTLASGQIMRAQAFAPPLNPGPITRFVAP